MEDIFARDVNAFYDANDRGSNDASSKKREKIFKALADSLIAGSPHAHEYHEVHGKQWRGLRAEMEILITKLLPYGAQAKKMVSKGGRQHNYDFELYYSTAAGESLWMPIELKKGTSIYDQPEFLSLYTREKMVTGKLYHEYFYDEVVSVSDEFTKHHPPSREEYLKLIFGSEYSKHPFFQKLYESDNSTAEADKKAKRNRSRIVDESIDSYLKQHAIREVDIDAMQNRLNEQVEKRFVSWDSGGFHIERFDKKDLEIVGDASLKTNRSDLASTLVFHMSSGNEVHALLRWKNHKGILGPAWQIKMLAATSQGYETFQPLNFKWK